MLLVDLVLHVGAVIYLFAPATEYWPGHDEIASVPSVPWTLPAPAEGVWMHCRAITASLLFRLELHIFSGKSDFHCFPLFLSFWTQASCCKSNGSADAIKAGALETACWWSFLGSVTAWLMPAVENRHGRAGNKNKRAGSHMEQIYVRGQRIMIQVRSKQGLRTGSEGIATSPTQWSKGIVCPCVRGSRG